MTQEKPKILYHGSKHRGIEELEPQKTSWRDVSEGPLIFATQELALATIFMANAGGWASGRHNGVPYAIIVMAREEFIHEDTGGHIYILPSDTFESDPNKGLGKYEWTSKEKVKPIDKIEFSSGLDAMIENGVQVYFTDAETSKKINAADDHGLTILKTLKSENQARGINVKEF